MPVDISDPIEILEKNMVLLHPLVLKPILGFFDMISAHIFKRIRGFGGLLFKNIYSFHIPFKTMWPHVR